MEENDHLKTVRITSPLGRSATPCPRPSEVEAVISLSPTKDEEVMKCKWKMIDYVLRQDQNSDCNIAMTWVPKGKIRRGTWRRTVD